ncbi:MAG: hypothetical protein O2968_23040, partial [Acidobacteria bacterium]|nr:hypothetical protein [Acidobacteriota bacterium]
MHAKRSVPAGSLGLVTVVVGRFNHARNSQRQLHDVPRGNGQIHDLLVFDETADLRVARLQQRSDTGDFHLLAHLADLHGDVELKRLVDFQAKFARRAGLEATQFRCDLVETGTEIRERITARFVSSLWQNTLFSGGEKQRGGQRRA